MWAIFRTRCTPGSTRSRYPTRTRAFCPTTTTAAARRPRRLRMRSRAGLAARRRAPAPARTMLRRRRRARRSSNSFFFSFFPRKNFFLFIIFQFLQLRQRARLRQLVHTRCGRAFVDDAVHSGEQGERFGEVALAEDLVHL